jgi:hypothetical protein
MKNKITLLFVIIIVALMVSSVGAYIYLPTETDNQNPPKYTTTADNHQIYYRIDETIYVIYSSTPTHNLYVTKFNTDVYRIYAESDTAYIKVYNSENGNWTASETVYSYKPFTSTNITLLWTNRDVYDKTTATPTLFFSMVTPPKPLLLPPVAQASNLHLALSQILVMLPLLVGLLVSFLAFRKALAMVSRLLHQA